MTEISKTPPPPTAPETAPLDTTENRENNADTAGGSSNNSRDTCVLCPSGTVGEPFRALPLDSLPNCNNLEQWHMGLSSTQCLEFETDGVSDYYRTVCECPGYEPICPLCGGDYVENPDTVIGDDEDLTCKSVYQYFLKLDSTECSEWDLSTIRSLERTCGCP